MRIVKARYKVAYVVAGLLVIGFVGVFLENVGLTALSDWWSIVAAAVLTVVGVRTFRVAEEDIAAPRPLWRMTGRPTAGFLLGGFGALGTAGSIWSLIYTSFIATPSPFVSSLAGGSTVASQIGSIVVDGVIAVWYLRSSFRLSRHMPAPEWTRG